MPIITPTSTPVAARKHMQKEEISKYLRLLKESGATHIKDGAYPTFSQVGPDPDYFVDSDENPVKIDHPFTPRDFVANMRVEVEREGREGGSIEKVKFPDPQEELDSAEKLLAALNEAQRIAYDLPYLPWSRVSKKVLWDDLADNLGDMITRAQRKIQDLKKETSVS